MNRIKSNLNTCPLCGRIAHIWQTWDNEFQAECAFCGVRGRSCTGISSAEQTWNSQTKSKYTRAEKKRQKQVSAWQNLGHHLWDYNSKATLMQLEEKI